MNLFLDSSVLLAASGSPHGASSALFDYKESAGWSLLASRYVMSEVALNIDQLPETGIDRWDKLSKALQIVPDTVIMDWPVVFGPPKDIPVLLTAFAYADILLTLDEKDFRPLMPTGFYGLPIYRPGTFLNIEKQSGRLSL